MGKTTSWDDKKDLGGWWLWIVGLIVLSTIVFTGLNYVGVFGERFIFKNSFQYREARVSAISTFEANLAEIEVRLGSQNLNPEMRTNLEAQAASLRIQLRTERNK